MWRARLDSDGLLAALSQLARKQQHGRHPRALLGGELAFGALGDRAPAFLSELAATIARGEYQFGPVVPTRAFLEGKLRVLYRAEPLDMIVNAALAAELAPVLEPAFSDRLYSYRRGRSSWQAVQAVVDYLGQHRATRPNPRTRGLYVMRRDILAYGEAIPVGDDSALWMQLERTAHPDAATFALLREALRPMLSGSTERVQSVPTGSALQPLMCNLYLTPVDAFALSVEGGFYARSGDDILFMHPDAAVARRAAAEIEQIIADLRLALSDPKTLNLYFNGAGRTSDEWVEARGTTQFQYLGARIDFRGGVALKTDRARLLLQRLRRRIDNTLRLVDRGSIEKRADLVCAVLERALEPTNPQCDPAVPLLLGAINDRHQLRQLDHWIALDVAQRVTGVTGPRAFRKLSYRALRRNHGLPSLVVMRHRRGPQ